MSDSKAVSAAPAGTGGWSDKAITAAYLLTVISFATWIGAQIIGGNVIPSVVAFIGAAITFAGVALTRSLD